MQIATSVVLYHLRDSSSSRRFLNQTEKKQSESSNTYHTPSNFSLYSGLPFHFLLSEKAAKQLAGDCTEEEDDEELSALISAVKLTVAVFPRTVAEPMAAHCSIPLSDLQLTVNYPAQFGVMHFSRFFTE